ncbi:MAG: short-chain dehydrogenase, partial [Phyllobacteriaceae bacterium]|nr:short-chain dehydrogenase [Phyllobacteriaceae bacterium]
AKAANAILAAAQARRRMAIPGMANRLAAFAGRLAPGLMTTAMRKIIYDKLDASVF